jgi:hypothetical protein
MSHAHAQQQAVVPSSTAQALLSMLSEKRPPPMPPMPPTPPSPAGAPQAGAPLVSGAAAKRVAVAELFSMAQGRADLPTMPGANAGRAKTAGARPPAPPPPAGPPPGQPALPLSAATQQQLLALLQQRPPGTGGNQGDCQQQ